jgi:allophanate hydrolase
MRWTRPVWITLVPAEALLSTPAVASKTMMRDTIEVAVVGAHLSGQPLNKQLTERSAHLLEVTRTAEGYSLYALAKSSPPKPGLVFDGRGAGGIEVEVWEMDVAAFGSFVALIAPPLGIGTLKLADGRMVKGFICEPYAVQGAQDITSSGGWRAWRAPRPAG